MISLGSRTPRELPFATILSSTVFGFFTSGFAVGLVRVITVLMPIGSDFLAITHLRLPWPPSVPLPVVNVRLLRERKKRSIFVVDELHRARDQAPDFLALGPRHHLPRPRGRRRL